MMNARAVGFYLLHYGCSVCGHDLRWFLEILTDGETIFIRKVGQEPPYDIGAPKNIRARLEPEELKLYQHAKICISQSYGIGACIYLRRITENQINPLLEHHLEARQRDGANEDEIEYIKNIIAETRMENKIKLVTTPHEGTGINPVGRMYDKLSYGIHNLTDDECTKIAAEINYIFDELLVGLKERIDKEQEFKTKMKALELPARKAD